MSYEICGIIKKFKHASIMAKMLGLKMLTTIKVKINLYLS